MLATNSMKSSVWCLFFCHEVIVSSTNVYAFYGFFNFERTGRLLCRKGLLYKSITICYRSEHTIVSFLSLPHLEFLFQVNYTFCLMRPCHLMLIHLNLVSMSWTYAQPVNVTDCCNLLLMPFSACLSIQFKCAQIKSELHAIIFAW